MRYELNIGLDVMGEKSTVGARYARQQRALRLLEWFKPEMWEVIGYLDDAEEPCLYVSFEVNLSFFDLQQDLFTLARETRQDCIAVVNADGKGRLIGPRAAAWGEFNPEYFRRPAVAVAA